MIAALLALAAAAPAATSVAPTIPSQPELRRQIAARDAELFGLYFLGCDPAKLRTMLSADVEFYHDKGGFAFKDADAMVADYAKSCADRLKPNAWHSRRELVADSLIVDPVPGHGAMEAGEHLFYERRRSADGNSDGPEALAGRARFAMVWALEDGNWKLSRVLSFDHHPAGKK